MAVRRTGRRKAAPAPAGSRKKKTSGKNISRQAAASAARFQQRKRDPETLRLRATSPMFTVSDLERSLRFYTDVLGFFVSERFTNDAGVLQGVMLKAGACEWGLSQDDWAKGRDRHRGEAVRIWCRTVQDIDALAARIKTAGHRLTQEPRDESWGGRSIALNDPDGFHLSIYQPA